MRISLLRQNAPFHPNRFFSPSPKKTPTNDQNEVIGQEYLDKKFGSRSTCLSDDDRFNDLFLLSFSFLFFLFFNSFLLEICKSNRIDSFFLLSCATILSAQRIIPLVESRVDRYREEMSDFSFYQKF